MAKRRLLYFAALAGGVVFFFAYQEWFSWMLLLTLLGLPWLSLLLSLPAMLTLRVEWDGVTNTVIGGDVTVRLRGVCRFPPPPIVGSICLISCLSGDTVYGHHACVLPTTHSGGWRLCCRRVRVCDYLGLIALSVKSPPEEQRILVYPHAVEVSPVPNLQPSSGNAFRPKTGGGLTNYMDVRPYRAGDSLHHMHWKLSAKTGQWIVREPLESTAETVRFCVVWCGSADTLDRKGGRCLWLGRHLLEQGLSFELQAMTADGIRLWQIDSEQALDNGIGDLLCHAPAAAETMEDAPCVYCVSGEEGVTDA